MGRGKMITTAIVVAIALCIAPTLGSHSDNLLACQEPHGLHQSARRRLAKINLTAEELKTVATLFNKNRLTTIPYDRLATDLNAKKTSADGKVSYSFDTDANQTHTSTWKRFRRALVKSNIQTQDVERMKQAFQPAQAINHATRAPLIVSEWRAKEKGTTTRRRPSSRRSSASSCRQSSSKVEKMLMGDKKWIATCDGVKRLDEDQREDLG